MRVPEALHLLPAWPATVFPAGLDAGRERLRASLLGRVAPDGSLRDPCGSRVLESALTLALLDQSGHRHLSARARIVRYLQRHVAGGDALDAAVAATVLGREAEPADLRLTVEELTARAPDFTGPRKRALVHAIFTMLGAAPPAPESGPGVLGLTGLHPWAVVQVTAVKTILSRAAGGRAPLDAKDLALLLSTQRPGVVWEGNLLIHLSVLHALSRLPGTAAVVAEGIRTVLLYQRGDGGLPFVTDTDTWCAVTAAVALHAAGAPDRVLHRIAVHLIDVQRPDGGWSYTDRAHLADTDCTAVAVEFLHRLAPHIYRSSIRRALDALVAVRGTDGGFPTYGAGTPSEACMTAAAVNALTTQGVSHQDLIDPALLFLADSQHLDGSFPPGWSNSRLHTLFRAYLATTHQPGPQLPSPVRVMRQRITHLVRAGQNPDGGFGQRAGAPSDAISTAYALIVLAGEADPAPAVRATGYLLSRQRPDAGIASVPDMLGPRPLPYTVPVLADIFTLLALGHLTHRARPLHACGPDQSPSSAPRIERPVS